MTQTIFFNFGLRTLAVTALCVGLASAVRGDESQTDTLRVSASRVTGVALQDGGALQGHLLDGQGRPVAKQEVRILSQGRLIAATETNADGRFGVRGLRGGLHTIEATGSSQPVQLWAAQTAPPSALRDVVVVAGQESVVRGQAVHNFLHHGNSTLKTLGAGALIGAGTYWALDYNPHGS